MRAPATSQPKSAHGPGSSRSMEGMEMKMPAPTIMVTLSAVACQTPKCRRSSPGGASTGGALREGDGWEDYRLPAHRDPTRPPRARTLPPRADRGYTETPVLRWQEEAHMSSVRGAVVLTF